LLSEGAGVASHIGVISVGFLSALVAGYHGVIVAHDLTMAKLTPHHFRGRQQCGVPHRKPIGQRVSRYDCVTAEKHTDLAYLYACERRVDFPEDNRDGQHHESGNDDT